MFSNFPKEFWQTYQHAGRIWRFQTTFKTKYFLSKLDFGPAKSKQKEPRGEQ